VSCESVRHRLRATFEEVPDLYDRARPGYPAKLFDDLVELAKLPEGARLLELGCGTGKATLPLAERGFELVCVELGQSLAHVARRNLAAFPKVQIVQTAFEEWEPPRMPFDAVVAFTAFHWIDPEVRYPKPAALLRRTGALAVVSTQHVLPEGGDPFFVEVQDDYDAIVPSDETRPPPHPSEVSDLSEEMAASGLFHPAAVRHQLWDVVYSAGEYIGVLDTYSGHRSLDGATRERLYERIRRRIESRPEPRVRKTYLATLTVARRL